ncbi:MAG: PKD domain-containing protein [Actinomycetota bacterium]|nr:PKD domain-containing protein [Actinomycetota bacterium]
MVKTKKSYNLLKIFTLLTIAVILLYPASNLQAQETNQETTIVVHLSNPGGVEFEDGDMWKVIFSGTEEIYSELLLEVTGGGKEIEVTDFVFPVTSCSIETDGEGNFIITASVKFYEEMYVSSYSFEGAAVSPSFARGNWDIAGSWGDPVYNYTLGSGRWFAFKEGEPYPPIPVATYYPSGPLAEEEVTFDGSDSFDLDGGIVKYGWNFGDGDTAEGVEVTHAYSQEEEYTVTLTVTDDDGLVNSTELIVNVGQEEELLVIDQARTDKEKYSLNEEVSLSCKVLDESGEKVSEVVTTVEIIIPDNTPDNLSDNPTETIQLMESETIQGLYECEDPFTSTNRAGKYYITFNAEKEGYADAEPVELNFIIPVQIVLTFDDGPDGLHTLGSGLNTTENIIDDLDYNDIQNEIKAAFFVQTHDPQYGGSSIGEELIEIEDDEGHIIGVHTGGAGEHWLWQNHIIRVIQDAYDVDRDGIADGESALESDLIAAILRIKSITGQVPEFVRPPYWLHNQKVLDAYKSQAVKDVLDNNEGLKMIYRDVLSGDGGESWVSPVWWVRYKLISEVIGCIKNKGEYQLIVSFHDTNAETVMYLSDPGLNESYLGMIVEGVRRYFWLETKEQALEYIEFIVLTEEVFKIMRSKEVTEVIE